MIYLELSNKNRNFMYEVDILKGKYPRKQGLI